MLLDGPVTRLSVRRAERTEIRGPERDRAAWALGRMAERHGAAGGHALDVLEVIPAHAGLGSGTQLALSVAVAFRRLHGIAPDLRGDAAWLGRSVRSGVGVGLFDQGGLVLDGGREDEGGDPPPVLARLPVPEPWRVLLLLDPVDQGLSGTQERAAFAALPPMGEEVVGEICRLVLLSALPALAEGHLPRFAAAITAIQERVGDHFAPAQGGRFASPRVARALAALRRLGAPGVGQSSWGPTGFAFARDEVEAGRLRQALIDSGAAGGAVGGDAGGLDIQLRRPLNRGACIEEGP